MTEPHTEVVLDLAARESSELPVSDFIVYVPVLDARQQPIPILDEEGNEQRDGTGTLIVERYPARLAALTPTGYTLMRLRRIGGRASEALTHGVAANRAMDRKSTAELVEMVFVFVESNLLPESREWLDRMLSNPRSGVDMVDLIRPFMMLAQAASGGPTGPSRSGSTTRRDAGQPSTEA